jgi:hypothetical protein
MKQAAALGLPIDGAEVVEQARADFEEERADEFKETEAEKLYARIKARNPKLLRALMAMHAAELRGSKPAPKAAAPKEEKQEASKPFGSAAYLLR